MRVAASDNRAISSWITAVIHGNCGRVAALCVAERRLLILMATPPAACAGGAAPAGVGRLRL
jgi:hypothetical protein